MKSLINKANHICKQLAIASMATSEYVVSWQQTQDTTVIDNIIKFLKISMEITITAADFDECVYSDFLAAGFKEYDEPNDKGEVLLLLPIWLYPFLAQDVKLDRLGLADGARKRKTVAEIGTAIEHIDGLSFYGVTVVQSDTRSSLRDTYVNTQITLGNLCAHYLKLGWDIDVRNLRIGGDKSWAMYGGKWVEVKVVPDINYSVDNELLRFYSDHIPALHQPIDMSITQDSKVTIANREMRRAYDDYRFYGIDDSQ